MAQVSDLYVRTNQSIFYTDHFIVIQKRYNRILNSKAYPGCDINSNNAPLAAITRLKLKKLTKVRPRTQWTGEVLLKTTGRVLEGSE